MARLSTCTAKKLSKSFNSCRANMASTRAFFPSTKVKPIAKTPFKARLPMSRYFSSFRFRFQKEETCLKAIQPIVPAIMINGTAGRINRSCLLGKKLWKTRKESAGKTSRACRLLTRKKPKSQANETGGTSRPRSVQMY